MTNKKAIRAMVASAYFRRIKRPSKMERFAHSYWVPKFVWTFLK